MITAAAGFVEGKRSLSNSLLDVLLLSQPLTARQIYYKAKSRCGVSVSYQAVHKKLQSLHDQDILCKDRLEYSLNAVWLEQLEHFTSSAREKMERRERVVRQLERKKPLFERQKRRIKIVSLDLGGVLFNKQFDELLWRREIPRAYARQYHLSPDAAFERVTAEYRRLWGKMKGWRDPEAWLQHFKLETALDTLVQKLEKHIVPYPDVSPILRRIAQKHHLILISHAQDNLLRTKLKVGGCGGFFLRTYSVGSDFGKMTKDAEVYHEVCEDLGITPEEIVHIGDDFDLDYKVPCSMGMQAYLMDRRGFRKEPFVVRDLYEFEERLAEFEKGGGAL